MIIIFFIFLPTQITVNGKVSLLLRTRKSFDNYSHIFFHKMEESKDILCRNQDEGVLGMLNSPVVFISCVFLITCSRLAVSLLNSALKERLLLFEEGITRDKFKVLPQKSTLNNIMEFMDCPVCLTFPESTPIYQCRSNGLCSVCLPNLETCPVCRCTNGFTRCLLAEKILSQRIRVTPKVTNKFLSLL